MSNYLSSSIHPKLVESVQFMIVNNTNGLPFYGNFCLDVNFIDSTKNPSIKTCAVNVTAAGFNFYYNNEFLDLLTQKAVNFVVVHELFHLLFNHQKRTIRGIFEPKLSNIVQDMIINHAIMADISHEFVELPRDKDGRIIGVSMPIEYTEEHIFEILYNWVRDQRTEMRNQGKLGWKEDEIRDVIERLKNSSNKSNKDKNEDGGQQPQNKQGQGQQPQQGKGKGRDRSLDIPGEYGDYVQDPNSKSDNGQNKPSEGWSLESILNDAEKGDGITLDQHLEDEVSEDLRESMIENMIHKLQSRGLMKGENEATLNKLRKKRKDYLREIKKVMANSIFGTHRLKTITRPNRRQIFGIKGSKKYSTAINCILDTSGSMCGSFEKVLNYIYQNDVQINMIQCDAGIEDVTVIKDTKKIAKMAIHGLGGTVIQPAVDYVADNFNNLNTLILTDGYTDTIDFTKIRGNVLVVSTAVKLPICRGSEKVKQILIEKEH